MRRLDAPRISGNGGFVAFASLATDLAAADFNGQPDVFLHERAAGTSSIVSRRDPDLPRGSGGGESKAVAISSCGRFVAFTSNLIAGQSDSNDASDVFLYDRVSNAMVLVSRSRLSPSTAANAGSEQAVISADGRYVAFVSAATDLVEGQSDPERPFPPPGAGCLPLRSDLRHDHAGQPFLRPALDSGGRRIRSTRDQRGRRLRRLHQHCQESHRGAEPDRADECLPL